MIPEEGMERGKESKNKEEEEEDRVKRGEGGFIEEFVVSQRIIFRI